MTASPRTPCAGAEHGTGMDLRVILILLSGLCCSTHEIFEVSHSYSTRESQVVWTPHRARKGRHPSSILEKEKEAQLRILHITDSHVSHSDEDPPHTHRMFSALKNVKDKSSQQYKHPSDQLVSLFQKAREENVDLIALGGDIISYPSEKEVAWVLQQLKEAAGGIPFLYTAGNHDWHLEFVNEPRYDTSRLPQLQGTLRPFFDHAAGPSSSGLYGVHNIKGVDVFFFDNSNHQINGEQLAFAKEHLTKSHQAGPAVILLHMPLSLPGLKLPPKELCGHPHWGTATDDLSSIEGRAPWPPANDPSTYSFIELVKTHSAPLGRITALLTGHVHRDFSTKLPQKYLLENATALSCRDHIHCAVGSVFERHAFFMKPHPEEPTFAKGAVQYNTLDAAEGGYRIVHVRKAL